MQNLFSSHAMNFMSNLDTMVDPRTGQFIARLPLAEFNANNLLGPEVNLTLSYSPLTSFNYGFGYGFSLGLSQFNNQNNQLELSNGEKYNITPGSVDVKNKKLNNFLFTYTNNHDDAEGYTIYWKEGKTELLLPVGPDFFVTTQITAPSGHYVSLDWTWNGQIPLLTEIRDEQTTLCNVSYHFFTTMTIWPDSTDEYQIKFELINDNQLDAMSRQISDNEYLNWYFSYDRLNASQQLLLTGLTYPTGMIEKVEYSEINGLKFPENAGLQDLPAVLSYWCSPGAGQPESITYYEYSIHNFLGYNSNYGYWSADSDYLYTTLTDYVYSSTVTTSDGEQTTRKTRRYNNYHLLISEETVRNNCIYRVDYTYYAQQGQFIDSQPAQFQLPREKIETWIDEKKNKRTQITLTEFDQHGNPLREVSPDGTETEITWYPAEGTKDCPKEPNGFIRFIKQRTIKPRQNDYHTPVYTSRYTYNNLGKRGCIVQNSVFSYADNTLLSQRTYSYHDKEDREYGRVLTITDKKHSQENRDTIYTTTLTILTSVNNEEIKQTTRTTGFDDLYTQTERIQSAFSYRLLSETDAQGVINTYTYDKLGRVLTHTTAANTAYEHKIRWHYSIDKNGPVTLETDAFGNQVKTLFDGAGRIISTLRFDKDKSQQWYEVASNNYDKGGDIKTVTSLDWVIDTRVIKKNYHSQIRYGRDEWGELSVQTYSPGITNYHLFNPATLTQTEYMQGNHNNKNIESGKNVTAFDQYSQLPVINKRFSIDGKEQDKHEYKWDGLGRLRAEIDRSGHQTSREYDVYGRVTQQMLPDGSIVFRTYAAHQQGNLVTSIKVKGKDAADNIQIWLLGEQDFDSLGRITQQRCGTRMTYYHYEGASPLPNRVTLPSGEVVKYTYIAELDNAISRMETQGTVQTFTYDKCTGNLLSAKEGNIENIQIWSTAGELKTERFIVNGQTREANHIRTLDGNPVAYSDITGQQTVYERDSYGRITTITDDTLSATLGYDALGRLFTQTVKDNVTAKELTTKITYDDFGREINRTITDKKGNTLSISQSWYKNDLLEQRIARRNNIIVRKEFFYYDSRNRLIDYSVTGTELPCDAYNKPFLAQSYNYDALNNLTRVKTVLDDNSIDTTTYHYNNSNDPTQLTLINHTHPYYPAKITLHYDASGRMIQDDAGRILRYDSLGRLINISDKNNVIADYHYNALNKITRQDINGEENYNLYYRGDELVNEVLSSGKDNIRLIKDGHTCFGVQRNGGLTLTAADKNESPVISQHNNQSKEKTYVWSPYGNGPDIHPLPGFNGERIDPVNGVYHLGNGYRSYNPILMRFTSPDNMSPFGAGGINAYAYCAGDPINHIDPSGHLSVPSILGIIGGTLGILFAIFTAGASIAAAGGFMAAMNSASVTSLIIGGLGFTSDVASIVSGALEDINPEASSVLGWVSLGTGATGMINAAFSNAKSLLQTQGFYSAWEGYKSAKVGSSLVPAGSIAAKTPAWYKISTGSKVSYDVNPIVSGSNSRLPLSEIRHRSGHRVTAPGNDKINPGNTEVAGQHLTHSGFRHSDMLENSSYKNEDAHSFSDGIDNTQMRFVDSANNIRLNYYQLYQSKDHIIGGYCYSYNDEASHRFAGIRPVKSFIKDYRKALNNGSILKW